MTASQHVPAICTVCRLTETGRDLKFKLRHYRLMRTLALR